MPPSWHPVPVCVPQLRCRRAVLRRNNDCCRRNYFLLQQRKLESEAGRCRGRDRFHSGGFFLRIMPPSWHPVPVCVRHARCRRNHSSLPLRRLESDAKQRPLNDLSRRNYSSLPLRKLESDAERCGGRDGCSRRNHSPLHRFSSLAMKSRIDARKRV